ncbi:restriction endonuclease [Candidatus Poribacteria bacterium]|nr:restriction endonuclease [Candidatus Poribacteria bacterium]
MKLDELIPALSILCQGYLVLHADSEGNPWIPPSATDYRICKSALDKMGVDAKQMGVLALENWEHKRRESESPSWWAEVFSATDSKNVQLSTGLGKSTDQLLNLILSGSAPASSEKPIPFSLVARTYLEIAAFFDGPHIVLPAPTITVVSDWEVICREITSTPELVHQLHWKRFEDLLARLLERFGWLIEPMGYTKDDGIDIVAVRKVDPGIDIRMMVQCKKFSRENKVGVDLVKQLWSTKTEHGFHQAMLATTSSFTRGAMSKADLWKLELRDHEAIVNWCMKYGDVMNIQ